eukprot:1149370-Pleurochrysis_carterae.AAC.1
MRRHALSSPPPLCDLFEHVSLDVNEGGAVREQQLSAVLARRFEHALLSPLVPRVDHNELPPRRRGREACVGGDGGACGGATDVAQAEAQLRAQEALVAVRRGAGAKGDAEAGPGVARVARVVRPGGEDAAEERRRAHPCGWLHTRAGRGGGG